MSKINYHALAKEIITKAKHDPGNPRPYATGGDDDKAVDGPYQPTGIAKLDALVQALNVHFRYGSAQAGNRLSLTGDELFRRQFFHADVVTNENHMIDMPNVANFVRADGYPSTLAHELVHWASIRDPAHNPTGHAEDEDANGTNPGYVIDELAAEIGAGMLLRWADADPRIADRAAYVANWLRPVPPQYQQFAIRRAEDDATKYVNWLTAKAPDTSKKDGEK